MGTVFVVQELKDMRQNVGGTKIDGQWTGGHPNPNYGKPMVDVTPACVYGELRVLFQSNVGIAVQPYVAKLRHELRDFSDDDYLLLVGDPVLIGLCTAIASEMNRGHVRMLRWDKRARDYIEIKVNFKPRKASEDE